MVSFQAIIFVVAFIVIGVLLWKLGNYHQEIKSYREYGEAKRLEDSALADEYQYWDIEIKEKKFTKLQQTKIYAKAIHHLTKKHNKDTERYNLLAKKQGISSMPHFVPKTQITLESEGFVTNGLYYKELFEVGKTYGKIVDKALSDFGRLTLKSIIY